MNLHTLHVEHIWLLGVYCLLTSAHARLQRTMRGVHCFTFYNVAALLGAIAVALRGSIPDFVSVVLGDTFVLAAYLLLFFSVARTFGSRQFQAVMAVTLFVLGAASLLYYGALVPRTPQRLLTYSLVLALQQAQIVWFLLDRRDTVRRRVSGMLALMVAALAATNVVRIALILTQGVPADYLRSGPAFAAVVLANTGLQCGVVVAYIWMTAALLQRDLEIQASTDPLTGLLNRRALAFAAECELQACRTVEAPFSAFAIDLDDYKRINDQLGHAAGDAALVAVTRCLEGNLRRGDRLARTGGDEFVALLPRTTAEEAHTIAAGLCTCLRNLALGLSDPSTRITASFGVSQASQGELWEDLLQRCDGLLYEAKRQGGDRVLWRTAEMPRSDDNDAIEAIPAM